MGVGGQHHAPAALPVGKSFGAHSTGGCVGSRAGLNGRVKEKISCSNQGSNPEPSSL
jgi:hypothetical protein